MKFLMKASFNVLHDSAARRDDYEKLTKFPFLFCALRWTEYVAVVFTSFLTASQADHPMIPFLYGALSS